MAFIKFSFLSLLLIGAASAQTRFSSKSCLDASYKMKMVQKGPLFGLLKQEFMIEKKNCIIHITHKKYLPKEWIIDVCREPVHIKVTSATGVDVAKKDSECLKKDNSRDTGNFCSQYFTMMDVIQDDGLIFAEGDRDNLNSAHGRTYCSYLLLKKYLNESVVFSRYTDAQDIFLEKPKENLIPTTPISPEGVKGKPEDQQTKLETPKDSVTANF
jgi:hypothetical protein